MTDRECKVDLQETPCGPREIQEYECQCEKCKAMCERFPCRPLLSEVADMPPEVRARLMISDSGDHLFDIPYLQAGAIGHEGGRTPNFDALFGSIGNPQRCTFLTDEGLCELHGRCKPFEGRVALHGKGSNDYSGMLELAWDTDEGREVLDAWREENL